MPLYDVAVLGLGAMGSSAFFQLSQAGASVVGVDRYAPPHPHGSTHGESRITRRAIGEGEAYVPLAKRSHELWRQLEERSGRRLLHEVGCLIIARPDDETERPGRTGFLERTIQAAEKFGIRHQVLTAQQIREQFPQFDAHDDEVGYFEPEAGYVNPESCVSAHLELGQRQGGTLRLDTRIEAIERCADGIVLHAADQAITARKLVLSAGSGALALLGERFEALMVPTRQTMHWFELEPGWRETWSRGPAFIWPHGPTADDFFYGFPEIDAIGAIKIADEAYGTAVDPDAVNRVVEPGFSQQKFERHIAPRLRGVSPVRHKAVTCLYTATPDSSFIIDWHPDDARILLVSACSGHGFKHSAAIGEIAAQMMASGSSQIDVSGFALNRFPAFQIGN